MLASKEVTDRRGYCLTTRHPRRTDNKSRYLHIYSRKTNGPKCGREVKYEIIEPKRVTMIPDHVCCTNCFPQGWDMAVQLEFQF